MARKTHLLKWQCNLELCLKYCIVRFQLGTKCCEMDCAQGLWPAIRHSLRFSKYDIDRQKSG